VRRDLKTPWRRLIWHDKNIGNATRVLLLFLADHMREDGYVSVPVSTISTALEIPPSRISERIAEAKRAKLLDTVQVGCPGRTATYRAMLAQGEKPARAGRQRPGGKVQPITDVRNPPITDVRNDQLRTSHTTDRYGRVEGSHAQPITDVCAASTNALPPTDAHDPSSTPAKSQSAAKAKTNTTTRSISSDTSNNSKSNLSSGARSRRSREPAKPELPATHCTTDEYGGAREVLDGLAPERRDRFMAQAYAELPNASNHDLICHAADIARSIGEVA
jgi:hypothetical protein